GISTSGFLRAHCNALVTSLILACAFLVGLLLAADDLVVRVPGFVGSAISTVKLRTPPMKFSFPQLPKLPALPRFVTRDAVVAELGQDERDSAQSLKSVRAVKASVIATNNRAEDEDEDYKPPVLIKPGAEMVKINGMGKIQATAQPAPAAPPPAPKVLKE